ncbi:MAG: VOC family protein [Pseudomonadota bacterium]
MLSSHVLCKVHDLHAAVDCWTRAGFVVQYGDAPERSLNALIWFEAGPFIELIVADRVRPPAVFRYAMQLIGRGRWLQRFERWRAQPEGWCDLALESEGDIREPLKGFKAKGLRSFGPIPGQRTPPDGETVRTQTCFPMNPGIPFLMGAYRPDPRPSSVRHPNGATAVQSIRVSVAPEDRAELAIPLADDDPWLVLEDGDYVVQEVVLEGLARDLAPEEVSGARVTRVS